MTSRESNTLDGAGTGVVTEASFICPFMSTGFTFTPAFCNIVAQGSSVDVTAGSLATRTQERHIMEADGEVDVLVDEPDFTGIWTGRLPGLRPWHRGRLYDHPDRDRRYTGIRIRLGVHQRPHPGGRDNL